MKKLLILVVGLACGALNAKGYRSSECDKPCKDSSRCCELAELDCCQDCYCGNFDCGCSKECDCCFDSCNDYCYDWAVELKQGYFYPQDRYLRDMFKFRGSKGGYMVEGAARWRFWRGFNLELNGSYFSRQGCALVTSLTSTGTNCSCNPCGVSCNSCNVTCNANCCSSCDCNYRAGECVKYKLGTAGLSLKYYFELCQHDWLVPYLGAGAKLFLVRINNCSPYVCPCEHYRKVGGVVHAGLLCRICSGFFADIFMDYLGKSINYGNCCNNSCNVSCNSCCDSYCNTNCSSKCCVNSCCDCDCNDACCPKLKVGGIFAGIGIGYEF